MEIVCGGFTGEYEDMLKIHKKAEVVDNPDGFVVHLFKNYEPFGTVDVRDKSIHYANDVCENWENGILREDNEYITKSIQPS